MNEEKSIQCDNKKRDHANTYLKAGNSLAEAGLFKQARSKFTLAYSALQTIKQPDGDDVVRKIDALACRAKTAWGDKDSSLAIPLFHLVVTTCTDELLKFPEYSESLNQLMGLNCLYLADAYRYEKDYQNASIYYGKGINILQKLSLTKTCLDDVNCARLGLAACFIELKYIDAALSTYEDLHTFFLAKLTTETITMDDIKTLLLCINLMANIYSDKQLFEKEYALRQDEIHYYTLIPVNEFLPEDENHLQAVRERLIQLETVIDFSSSLLRY
jgi:hypothetical protein